MKRDAIIKLFLLLILGLVVVLSVSYQADAGQTTQLPTAWHLPELIADTPEATDMPGWWEAMLTPIPLASPTPDAWK